FGEVAGVAEVLVDAGEANVGDMVERLEAGHDRLADAGRCYLVALGLEPALHPADQPVDLVCVDIALARRMADRTSELVTVERFALSVLFDDCEVAQLHSLERRKPLATCLTLPTAADGGSIFARPAVLHLAVFVRAERAAHPLALIDRKARAEVADAFVHRFLDSAVILEAIGFQAIEHVSDHVGDVAELGFAEAARRAGGRAHPDPARLNRWQRVERNAVLVAGDPGALEALVGILAGQAKRAKIDQCEMG